MVKVKICGITNIEDAEAAINAGCDAIGFLFYKKSPRYIAPHRAEAIVKRLPTGIVKIGVFVNARENKIKAIAKLCHLDMLQFHGNESPEFCRKFANYKIIKAMRIKDRLDLKEALRYRTFAYLFDTFVPAQAGGTGKKFDWRLLKDIRALKTPVFLSGGLNARNVKRAIGIARPDWVDVSSCLELRKGKKIHKKVKEFIKAAKI